MIEIDLLQSYVRDGLEEIADKNYQRKVWNGLVPDIVSCESEAINSLRGDYTFREPDGYIKIVPLTDVQKQSVHEMNQAIDDYLKIWPSPRDDNEVIDDPDWGKVVLAAQKVLPVLFPEHATRYARGQWHEKEL